MILSADWVLPVSGPPIRDGAVRVDDDLISAVGERSEIVRRFSSDEHEHFAGCTIAPGLVNAHTHLALTALSGVVPPLPFAEWLQHLVTALKPWQIADHEASGVVGAEECLACGVTVVGDIAYGAAEVTRARAAGLGGVFYWELLGMNVEDMDARLGYLRYPADPDEFGSRIVCGLSPHSPYTAGPSLLQAVHEKARELGAPTAIHAAESVSEVELLMNGTGPLADTAERTAFGFAPPGTSTIAYLADIGVLDDTTAVHLCHASLDDIVLMAPRVRGVVTCPRSNRYLSNPRPRVAAFLHAGIAMGVGTDSSASNEDLDLMAEVRAVRDAEPTVSDATLLELATIGGARAIGVDDRFGSLDPGKLADLGVYALGHTEDPVGSMIDRGGRATVRSVMSSGQWRVVDGALVVSDDAASALAADAHRRAYEAVSKK